METKIMAVAMDPRSKVAPKAQEILTKYGCIIKTRLGVHETSEDMCSERGLVILMVDGKDEEINGLKDELSSIDGIKVNSMII